LNKTGWGRWVALVLVLVGLGGVWYGHRQVTTKNQAQQVVTNHRHAKKTKQDIAHEAAISRAKRPKKKSAFDRENLGQRHPQFAAAFTQKLRNKRFSGTALVVKDDRVIYQRSFGMANAAKKRRNKVTSQFLVNSIQKSMTGTLVMRAVQAGQLQLTDRLGQYYPTIKDADKVTLRQLLDMQGGVAGDMNPTTTLTEKGVYRYAAEHARVEQAWVNKFNYQPISYVLLAGILNQVTHDSYYQAFYEHIVTPLDLNHTSFAQLRSRIKGMTLGYAGTMPGDYSNPVKPAMRALEAEVGTGNVTMSAGEVFRTERALIQGTLLPTASGAGVLHESNAPAETYSGGMYHLGKVGYYGHGIGDFYEGAFSLSKNGRTGVVLLSNNFYKKTMWPDWSIESLTKATFKQVLTTAKLK